MSKKGLILFDGARRRRSWTGPVGAGGDIIAAFTPGTDLIDEALARAVGRWLQASTIPARTNWGRLSSRTTGLPKELDARDGIFVPDLDC
jgi:hypothetical protein